jgi:hypothetical protein
LTKPTIAHQLIAALLSRGYVEVKRPNVTKYRVFDFVGEIKNTVYIGRGGACRTGPTIKDSISNPYLRKRLLGGMS